VPLLEDESSIVLVLSETLRAVAQGTIALKSGSLLLEGCRLAHTMQMERVRAANLERSRRRTAVREEEIGEEGQETEAGSRKQEAGSSEAEATGHRAPGTGRRTPDSAPGSPHRFPDPGKNWDEERSNVESETTDRFDPRYEETREGVLAAQAEPLDERMEEELAVGVR
jgi:hypothetical protein